MVKNGKNLRHGESREEGNKNFCKRVEAEKVLCFDVDDGCVKSP